MLKDNSEPSTIGEILRLALNHLTGCDGDHDMDAPCNRELLEPDEYSKSRLTDLLEWAEEALAHTVPFLCLRVCQDDQDHHEVCARSQRTLAEITQEMNKLGRLRR